MLIRAKITTPLDFNPSTAERKFTLVASDYAFNVLIADVLREAGTLAPGISFQIDPPGRLAFERLERGEVDLILTISSHLADEHPRIPVYEDKHAVISWSEGVHRDGLTPQSFSEAGHVVAVFGPERNPAFTETYFIQQGISRRVEVSLASFSALPQAVVGTDRLATMYRRHAEFFARFLPLAVHEPPVAMPTIREEMQWHALRSNDHGLQWLVGLISECAKRMPPIGDA
jgi:DNA-binding transcriptional LysR family regulator